MEKVTLESIQESILKLQRIIVEGEEAGIFARSTQSTTCSTKSVGCNIGTSKLTA
ncbi:MAG: hypothetical protein HWE22_15430 [Flavobacteriales bacterium]|nr:hypothetical protein [Flavobacteriales bacterium]